MGAGRNPAHRLGPEPSYRPSGRSRAPLRRWNERDRNADRWGGGSRHHAAHGRDVFPAHRRPPRRVRARRSGDGRCPSHPPPRRGRRRSRRSGVAGGLLGRRQSARRVSARRNRQHRPDAAGAGPLGREEPRAGRRHGRCDDAGGPLASADAGRGCASSRDRASRTNERTDRRRVDRHRRLGFRPGLRYGAHCARRAPHGSARAGPVRRSAVVQQLLGERHLHQSAGRVSGIGAVGRGARNPAGLCALPGRKSPKRDVRTHPQLRLARRRDLQHRRRYALVRDHGARLPAPDR